MVRSVALKRCEEARERLEQLFISGGDVYDDLPLLLEGIAQRFSEEAASICSHHGDVYTINYPKLEAASAAAARDYASYFNMFVYMSQHRPNHTDRFRNVSSQLMLTTYTLLASQPFVPIPLDVVILEHWHTKLVQLS